MFITRQTHKIAGLFIAGLIVLAYFLMPEKPLGAITGEPLFDKDAIQIYGICDKTKPRTAIEDAFNNYKGKNPDGSLRALNHKDKNKVLSCEASKLGSISKTRVSNEYFDGYVEIRNITQIERGFQFYARAWDKDNVQIGFGDGTVEWERFRFFDAVNYYLVKDPLGTIVRTWENRGVVREDRYREDLPQALINRLTITMDGLRNWTPKSSKIVSGKEGNTNSSFSPAVGANSPVDGYVAAQYVATTLAGTADSIRQNVGTSNSELSTSYSSIIDASATTNKYDYIQRIITFYDTSAIGTDTVSSSTLSFFVTADAPHDGLGGGVTMGITKGVASSTSALENTDFQSNDTGDNDVDYATRIDIENMGTSQYNHFTLNANGIANIDTAGLSGFAGRSGNDIDNTEVGLTWANNEYAEVLLQSADGANDPVLLVTHAAAEVEAAAERRIIIIE